MESRRTVPESQGEHEVSKAENAAGIEVQGENKWLTLIENAASEPTKLDNRKKTGEPTKT